MNPEKLVYMANQIATAFRHRPEDEARAAVGEHVRSFWAPMMRRDIYAHLRAGGAGLDPVARDGLADLMARDPVAQTNAPSPKDRAGPP